MLLALWSTLSPSAGGGVDASLLVTEADDTLVASAVRISPVLATFNVTEAGDAVTASASVTITATATITESSDTLSGLGAVTVTVTASVTEANDTLTAAATLASPVYATANLFESSDTLAAVASASISAAFNGTEAGDAIASSAAVAVAAALSQVEAGDTVTATAGVNVVGSASMSEAGDTLAASVSVVSLNITAASLARLADVWTRLGLNANAPTVNTADGLTAGGMSLTFSGDANVVCARSDEWHAAPVSPDTMILELYQRLGLDPANPMTTGADAISFAGVSLGISGVDAVTVQRA